MEQVIGCKVVLQLEGCILTDKQKVTKLCACYTGDMKCNYYNKCLVYEGKECKYFNNYVKGG